MNLKTKIILISIIQGIFGFLLGVVVNDYTPLNDKFLIFKDIYLYILLLFFFIEIYFITIHKTNDEIIVDNYHKKNNKKDEINITIKESDDELLKYVFKEVKEGRFGINEYVKLRDKVSEENK